MRPVKYRIWVKETKEMLGHREALSTSHFTRSFSRTKAEVVLMQSTGLKDKYDHEIFEGDIVVKGKWEDRDDSVIEVFEVKFSNGGFTPFTEIRGKSSGVLYSTFLLPKNFAIIGNVFETPELLTKNKVFSNEVV